MYLYVLLQKERYVNTLTFTLV